MQLLQQVLEFAVLRIKQPDVDAAMASSPEIHSPKQSGHRHDNDLDGDKQSIAQIERTSQDQEDVDLDLEKPNHHPGRVDKELAQYTSDVRIHISPERSAELRRKIDKRVLLVMILTYFLQAIDKGTLSFASIMGLTEDTGLAGPDGGVTQQVGRRTSHNHDPN